MAARSNDLQALDTGKRGGSALPAQPPGAIGVHPATPSHSLCSLTDFMGKPVCVVKDKLSLASLPQTPPLSPSLMKMPTLFVPIGDPQSNRDPRLSSGGYWNQTLYLGVTPLSMGCPVWVGA